MKNVIVINSYANTDDKRIVLKKCILQLKKLNFDIVLISNIAVDQEIQSIVKYFIYDEENTLLPVERSPIKWFADSLETVHLYGKGTSYIVCKNIYTSLYMCKTWGYKNFLYLEFDVEISDCDLEKITHIFEKILIDKKLWICNFLSHGNVAYETRLFAGDLKFFIDNVKLVKNINEWNTIYPYSHSNESLEYIFPNLVNDIKSEIYFTNKSVCEYFSNSKVDIFHSFKSVNIVYNSEDPSSPILFILTREGRYEIVIDDVCMYNSNHHDGQILKFKFQIFDYKIKVVVRHNNTVVLNTELDNIIISKFKEEAVRYKL